MTAQSHQPEPNVCAECGQGFNEYTRPVAGEDEEGWLYCEECCTILAFIGRAERSVDD